MAEDRRRWYEDPEATVDPAVAESSALVYDLVASLSQMIGSIERQLDSMLDLSECYEEEIARGRTAMTATVEDLRDQLDHGRRAQAELDRLVSRTRAERDEAVRDLEKMERQLERLLEQVGDLSERAASLGSERQGLLGRMRRLERELRDVESERDALRAEVDESRAAMEEVRQWVADAASRGGWSGGPDD